MNKSKQFGFHDYLRPEFPSQIIVENTELCNYACLHCPHPTFEKSAKYDGRNLDLGLHKKLVDEIALDGVGYCRYLRYAALGETLLQPDFIEMVEYAGKHAGVPINVTTNGSLLTGYKAQKMLDAGVSTFDISIDAYSNEVYRKIRRKGDLSKVRANCLNLIKMIKNGKYRAKMVVSFVEQPLNKKEKNGFRDFWEKSGADFVVIRPMHSASGSMKAAAREMKKHVPDRIPCIYPWERLVMTSSGFLSYCPAEWEYKACIADFRTTTIKKVWQGAYMRALRKAHMLNDFSRFSFCKQCPDWSLTVWPKQGKNYAEMMNEIMK